MTDSDSTIPEENDSSHSTGFPSRYKLIFKVLSFSLIVLFLLAITFQVCALLVNTSYSQIGAGIWCGIAYAATGVMGLLAVRSRRSDDKAMTIALVCMAVACVFTSLALVIIALFSLTSTTQGTHVKLSVASNAVLAGVGLIGLVVSITMIIVTAICMSYRKRARTQPISNETEEVNRDSIDTDLQPIRQQLYPPSVATTSQCTAESNGSSYSDGIYESLKFQQSNTMGSSCLEALTLTEQFIEPIYAIPMKKKINSSSNLSMGGDFEIEVDNRNENDEHKAVPTRWFKKESVEDPIGSDVDDSEYSRNIELSKEDVIVHPPPK